MSISFSSLSRVNIFSVQFQREASLLFRAEENNDRGKPYNRVYFALQRHPSPSASFIVLFYTVFIFLIGVNSISNSVSQLIAQPNTIYCGLIIIFEKYLLWCLITAIFTLCWHTTRRRCTGTEITPWRCEDFVNFC